MVLNVCSTVESENVLDSFNTVHVAWPTTLYSILSDTDLFLTKGTADASTWWVAQIYEVLTDRVKVKTYTTISPPLEDYATTTIPARTQRLEETTFLQTWCLDLGRGKATTIPPQASRRDKDIWTWKIPKSEWNQHFLVRNITLSALGVLDPRSIQLAAKLDIPHQRGAGDENYDAEQL